VRISGRGRMHAAVLWLTSIHRWLNRPRISKDTPRHNHSPSLSLFLYRHHVPSHPICEHVAKACRVPDLKMQSI
jgi:hypothetical protein